MQSELPQNQLPKILIVDDRNENLIALSATLESLSAYIVQANSGQSALAELLEQEFALVLLDVQMPGMDGYEVASFMKASPSTANIPIIFLTALSSDEHFMKKGYLSGAVDYISKPLNTEILLSKAKIFLQLWSQTNQLKTLSKKYQDALIEITRQRDKLNQLALRDHLTGLYQRRAFDEFFLKEISKSIRYKRPLTIAMLDLDHFKSINDSHGHTIGDDVLIQFSQGFLTSARASDVVCRFGGEEFALLMPDTTLSDACLVCERIRTSTENLTIKTPNDIELRITISIGLAELSLEAQKPSEDLLKKADDCLYIAKNNGRNQIYPKSITSSG